MTLKLSLMKPRAGRSATLLDGDWEAVHAARERIFPAVRPPIPGLDYFADWRPARGLTGDYIDYFETSEGNLGLAVGDVAGEGLSAATLTSSLHSIIRALRFARNSGLPQLVEKVHELFYEICPDHCYATLFVARYDPASGRLHYVNAGHEPPFVLRPNGGRFRTIFLECGGPGIGMLRKPAYREGTLLLMPRDVMVAYTDGLCATRNQSGQEWGWPRFLELVEARAAQKARDIVEGVLQAAEAFAGDTPRHDDATVWVARLEDAAAGRPRRDEECVPAAA